MEFCANLPHLNFLTTDSSAKGYAENSWEGQREKTPANSKNAPTKTVSLKKALSLLRKAPSKLKK